MQKTILPFQLYCGIFEYQDFLMEYMERWMPFKLVIALANLMHLRIICPQPLNICDIVGEGVQG